MAERSDLEHRRSRASLLARANQTVVTAPIRWRPWAVAFVGALAVITSLLAFRGGPLPSERRVHASSPTFEVAEEPGADLATERGETFARIALKSGKASFHVQHVTPDSRFLVAMPDGEVEVRGTRFTVDVRDGRTEAVSVTEGFVDLRLGNYRTTLHAGERWARTDLAVQGPAQSPSTSATTEAPSATASTSSPVATAVAARPVSMPTVVTTSPVHEPTAGERFAGAMRAFNEGDYGEADRSFVTFVRQYPSDSRVEDAMFLVAEARARRGDKAGSAAAGREYLSRFPHGLRAPAARRLAGEPE